MLIKFHFHKISFNFRENIILFAMQTLALHFIKIHKIAKIFHKMLKSSKICSKFI